MLYFPKSFNISHFNLPIRTIKHNHDLEGKINQFDSHTFIYDIFYSSCGNGLIIILPSLLNLSKPYEKNLILHCSYYNSNYDEISLPITHHPAERCNKIFVKFDEYTKDLYDRNINIEFLIETNNKKQSFTPNKSYSDIFRNKIVLTTMNRNNKLSWIKEWLTWYNNLYGVDSVVIIDNGSTDYTIAELDSFINNIDFINNHIIINWPFIYGPLSAKVIDQDYLFWGYAFSQSSAIELSRLNLLAHSNAVFQCDIDELIYTQETNIMKLINKSKDGLIYTDESIYLTIKNEKLKPIGNNSLIDHTIQYQPIEFNPKYIFQPRRFNIDNSFMVHDITDTSHNIIVNSNNKIKVVLYHLLNISLNKRSVPKDIPIIGETDIVPSIITGN